MERLASSVTLCRIGVDTPLDPADDMTGVGAKISGGRWNHKGTALVYASMSRALACLETVVHLSSGDALPLNRYLVEITVPANVWAARTVLNPATHVGWDAEPAGKISRDWGTRWAAEYASPLLAEVPSVIVPEESNVLINPNHPDAASLSSRKIRKWTYDPRLRP